MNVLAMLLRNTVYTLIWEQDILQIHLQIQG